MFNLSVWRQSTQHAFNHGRQARYYYLAGAQNLLMCGDRLTIQIRFITDPRNPQNAHPAMSCNDHFWNRRIDNRPGNIVYELLLSSLRVWAPWDVCTAMTKECSDFS